MYSGGCGIPGDHHPLLGENRSLLEHENEGPAGVEQGRLGQEPLLARQRLGDAEHRKVAHPRVIGEDLADPVGVGPLGNRLARHGRFCCHGREFLRRALHSAADLLHDGLGGIGHGGIDRPRPGDDLVDQGRHPRGIGAGEADGYCTP